MIPGCLELLATDATLPGAVWPESIRPEYHRWLQFKTEALLNFGSPNHCGSRGYNESSDLSGSTRA
jgi:hypothetical protein